MSNKNNTPKKRLFGRNLFTLIFIIAVALVLFVAIYIPVNYVSTYNANKFEPFVDKTKDTKFDENTFDTANAVRMNGKDFTEFGMIFKCTEYSEDSKTARYEIRTYKTENTKTITNDTISLSLCLKANWVGVIKYSNQTPTTTRLSADKEAAEKDSLSSTYKRTLTISGLEDFPLKAKTWPFKVKVDEPEYYLYVSYKTNNNKTNSYILRYTYSELIPESGGIRV